MSDRFQLLDTTIDGPLLIQPKVIGDERGFFCETYRRNEFVALGIEEEMVQDNHSRSGHGIVRGMHFQIGRGAAKLVRCARGTIYDVVVDLRRGSPTFGEWEGVELEDTTGAMLWIPVGFGHGFLVLSEVADFVYKCTNYYDPATESGIRFDDPDVGIEWPSDVELLYSQRDAEAPRLSEVADSLPFTV